MAKAFLEPLDPAHGDRKDLSGGPFTIGRHPSNTLVVTDDKASRFHCTIERTSGGFHVRDLKSRNGVKVNEVLVVDTKILQHGDVIRIGQTKLRFVFDVPAAAVNQPQTSPPAPPPLAPVEDENVLPMALEDLLRSQTEKRPGDKPSAPIRTPAAPPRNTPRPPRNTKGGGNEYDAIAPLNYESISLSPSRDDAITEEPDDAMTLQSLLAIGTDHDLREEELNLVNNRGQTLHQAATAETGPASVIGEGVTLLRLILLSSLRTRATDIHLEPRGKNYFMRFRIDGTMVDAAHFDNRRAQLASGVVKILSEIDPGRTNAIEEGHFSCNVRGRHIDYRVSFTPAVHGQKLVIRILDLANAPHSIDALAMPEWMRQAVQRISRQDTGMILVAGPTGSGKTTTLYNVLRSIDVRTRNVLTIEDPVEYRLEGVTQIPLDGRKGDDFATILRSVLRQDPDVIFVGEVRDPETARTAMQSAMTGHLVLSTVHARDTIGTIFRLLDLGIEPYLVASGLNLVLSQRLVRVLCPHCKAARKPTPKETMRMGRSIEGVDTIYTAVGCPACVNTGYSGRRGVYEMLIVNDTIRDIIIKNPTLEAIRDALRSSLFTTLSQNGYRLVAEGATTIDEVERVTGSED